MNWYIKGLSNFINFTGRARRSEYWYFTLGNVLVFIVLSGLISVFIDAVESLPEEVAIGIVGLFMLTMIIPSLAVSVRRLHDTGRSGWWLLISLIPYVGSIVLLIFYIQDSEPGTNKWGRNPKRPETDDIMDHLVEEL